MTFLLANWKYVLLAALLAASGAFYSLWRGEVADYSEYRATVAAEGRAALKEAEATKAKQDQVTKETNDALAKAIPAIRDNAVANYVRMHPISVRQPTIGCSVPATSNRTQSPNAANGPGIPACNPDAEFIQSCAVAAGMVQGWQTWALRQGFPIE